MLTMLRCNRGRSQLGLAAHIPGSFPVGTISFWLQACSSRVAVWTQVFNGASRIDFSSRSGVRPFLLASGCLTSLQHTSSFNAGQGNR
ncbi:uncharacterized protein BJX67DRAFT_339889 [Aspergillus lucknowensis]|uniref:Uncharacterized protein n=1 Tax=Aspergillus lucknowensis TaxID=176173 RepID=A0ABR4M7N1_9EURO